MKNKTSKPKDVVSVDSDALLAKENLCWYDKRNPNYSDNYSAFDVDEIPEARQEPCYCDNCMHGRDRLALEILRLRGMCCGLDKTCLSKIPKRF